MRAAGRDIDVEMRKRFPAATETKDFDVVLAAAIRGTLDDGIEPRDITATGKDTDTLYSHDLPLKGVNRGREPSKLEARLSHQHVRFGSKADMCAAKGHVCFTLESGHVRCSYGRLLRAISDIGSLIRSPRQRVRAMTAAPSYPLPSRS